MSSGPSARAWYGSLLGGLVPLLAVGFTASALANRLAFAGWGLAAGAAWVLVLRHGFEAAWSPAARGATLLATAGAALLAFGGLAHLYGEDLDLGFRAVLPALYHPWLTRPAAGYALGGLVMAGCAFLLVSRRAPSRRAS